MARSKESQNAQRTGEPVEQARMLYALRWLHNRTPADIDPALLKDPRVWFDFVAANAVRHAAPPRAAPVRHAAR
jgi:hypothetical protein